MLRGRRVVVTRASEQASDVVRLLEAAGAAVLELPTIAIAPADDPAALDAAVARAGEYRWVVFTSPNAVRHVLARPNAEAARWPDVAAVGAGTAAALAGVDLAPAFTPTQPNGGALARELPIAPGDRVLLLRSDVARPELPTTLAGRGARVDEVVAYRTVARAEPAPELAAELAAGRIDAVLLASPSSVRGLVNACGAEPARYAGTKLIAIGPTTAAAIREHGLPLAATAKEPSAGGLVAALIDLEAHR